MGYACRKAAIITLAPSAIPDGLNWGCIHLGASGRRSNVKPACALYNLFAQVADCVKRYAPAFSAHGCKLSKRHRGGGPRLDGGTVWIQARLPKVEPLPPHYIF